MALIALLQRAARRQPAVPFLDELVLLTPAITLLVLVSSQTEFNHHLRYVLPCLGPAFIFAGQTVQPRLPPRRAGRDRPETG